MAIEGPLRELGIHDVFQLLDLSRKTGVLRVTSELRDNEGTVGFEQGKVVYAEIRSNPHPLGQLLIRAGKLTEADFARARAMQTERGDTRRLGDILVALGAVSARELERQVRAQIEAVVFELMSWREGYFSFVEGGVKELPTDATARIATESLLMEGARRIDEWSRIAHKVPNLAVIPVLVEIADDHDSALDLRPNEWAVLAMIDGERDVKEVAAALAQSDFDVAKIVYGLLTTGVVTLRAPERLSVDGTAVVSESVEHVDAARRALRAGSATEALVLADHAITQDLSAVDAHVVRAECLFRLSRTSEAREALATAVTLDPVHRDAQRWRGVAAVACGAYDEAVQAWSRFLELAPAGPESERVRTALEAAARLRAVVEAATHG